MHIRRNDTVVAIRGRNAVSGKTGRVLKALPGRGLVIVEGFNLVKKALRKTQDTPRGGIGQKEMPLAISSIMLYCPECKKGVRIRRTKEAGKKVRKCRKCGHPFDS